MNNQREMMFKKCESTLEREMLHRMLKVVGDPSLIRQQVWIGSYRVDFIIDRLVIEIDGKKFHNAERDAERDARILDSGMVDGIIRIPAAALYYYHDAVMAGVKRYAPSLSEFVSPITLMVDEDIDAEADLIVQDDDEDAAGWMSRQSACINCAEGGFLVGSPVSLLPTHRVWSMIDQDEFRRLHKFAFYANYRDTHQTRGTT